MLGSALHVFPYGRGLPRSKCVFGSSFKVAWLRCGRTPLACCWCRGARASKQKLKVFRGAGSSNTLPNLISSSKAPSSVETSHWLSDLHLGTRNRGFWCVRVRRLFPSLVKLMLLQTCSNLDRFRFVIRVVAQTVRSFRVACLRC